MPTPTGGGGRVCQDLGRGMFPGRHMGPGSAQVRSLGTVPGAPAGLRRPPSSLAVLPPPTGPPSPFGRAGGSKHK